MRHYILQVVGEELYVTPVRIAEEPERQLPRIIARLERGERVTIDSTLVEPVRREIQRILYGDHNA